MTASVLFVGESPPPGAPVNFKPFDCASGTRLATIMLGLRDRATLLEHVPRANIYDKPTGAKGCEAPWEPATARALGTRLLQATTATTVVALGRKPAEALGMPDVLRMPSYNWSPPLGQSWQVRRTTRRPGHPSSVPEYTLPEDIVEETAVTVIYAPHPSGASSTLTDLSVKADVRATLMPELIIGCPSLRPWHFQLDDPGVLAALAAAVAPLCPALGAAALLHADGLHRARVARGNMPLLATVCAAMNARPEGVTSTYNPYTASWDEPLRITAAELLAPDGGRSLTRRWNGGAKDTAWSKADAFLVNAAKAHVHLNAAQPRAVMRATLAWYAAAGLA